MARAINDTTMIDMIVATDEKICQASSSRSVWRYSLKTGMKAELSAPPAMR